MLRLLENEPTGSRLRRFQDAQTQEQFTLATCADMPELFEQSVALENEVWDHLSFLDFTTAHHQHYDSLLERHPDYRLCLIEVNSGEMVATGMCVPLSVPEDEALPSEGWDWIVDTAAVQRGRHANTLGALSISVPLQHRHRGFARDMINTMRALAQMNNLSRVIAPVRPSSKCRHPQIAMSQYVNWTDVRGRMFDPWLRSHLAVGGQLIGVCERSMVVEQSIDFWKSWTKSDIRQSGPVMLEGALAPINIDMEAGIGRYVEANVWISHRV